MGNQVNLRIKNIDLIEKSIKRYAIDEDQVFDYDVKAQSAYNDERNSIVIGSQVVIRPHQNDEIELANFTVVIEFEIQNYNAAFLTDATGKKIMDLGVENFLKTITISTIRGIIYSELRGTYLHKATLPVIMMDLMKETPNAKSIL